MATTTVDGQIKHPTLPHRDLRLSTERCFYNLLQIQRKSCNVSTASDFGDEAVYVAQTLCKRAGETAQAENAMEKPVDLRKAINAVSDVVQNRPRPLRVFDQIYMKTGDMVMQSEFVASWADKKRLAFIGDGDAISICVAYLKNRGIFDFGPTRITVFDFDERIVDAIKRFADKERLEHLDAVLYNCLDAFPEPGKFDCFYTNPPWGASNNGESVNVFAQRGMEATGFTGEGVIVIADDEELDWPKLVQARVQSFAANNLTNQ